MTTPLLDRIPDVSHQPPRRQATIGLLASVLVHLLLLLFALLIVELLPDRPSLSFAKPQPQQREEDEYTVLPPDEEQEAPRVIPLAEILRPPPFMDSLGLATSEKAPDQPVFESDLNMVAASEMLATGLLPLPSQEGRVSEFPMFTNQRVSLGTVATPFPIDVRLNAPDPPATPTPPSPAETKAAAAEPAPTPEPTMAKLETKPTPFRETEQPRDDEIAVATKAQPTPAPRAQTMPRLRPEMPEAAPATPVPKPRAPGYQPEQQKTRVEGSITNRGKLAVDAVGTPLGRYQSAAKAAIGSRWYHYVEPQRSLLAPGSLRVSFVIDAQGKVKNLKLEGNTSNATFSTVCEKAVLDTQLPPMPPSVLEAVPGGQLDMAFSFILYPNL